MKLLFDQNLSPRLVHALSEIFPDSRHVQELSLDDKDDDEVWNYALNNGFTIVTKDNDFNDRNQLLGAPPFVVWVRRGNCTTKEIEALIRDHAIHIHQLTEDSGNGLIILL